MAVRVGFTALALVVGRADADDAGLAVEDMAAGLLKIIGLFEVVVIGFAGIPVVFPIVVARLGLVGTALVEVSACGRVMRVVVGA